MKDVTEKVRKMLREQFKADLEMKFVEKGKGKVYAYTHEPPEFLKKYLVHSGIYFGRIDGGLRLSIDGSVFVGKKAEKCVVNLTKEEVIKWMSGKDIEKEVECKYVLLRWNSFFVGCGMAINGKIKNFVPKNRRTNY